MTAAVIAGVVLSQALTPAAQMARIDAALAVVLRLAATAPPGEPDPSGGAPRLTKLVDFLDRSRPYLAERPVNPIVVLNTAQVACDTAAAYTDAVATPAAVLAAQCCSLELAEAVDAFARRADRSPPADRVQTRAQVELFRGQVARALAVYADGLWVRWPVPRGGRHW